MTCFLSRQWGPLYGAKTNELNNGEILTVSLYDITTKTDAAGNPTKKESFRWSYKVSMKKENMKAVQKTYGKLLSEREAYSLSKIGDSQSNQDSKIY